ncbi:MAG TPA: hypothetical protein VGF94_09770 [Kofleriaceae bacterium]|jgi:hypothetical protein
MRHCWLVVLLFAGACGDNLKGACETDADCGDGACADVTCSDGICAESNLVPAGQMAVTQTAGDCKALVCDGHGNATAQVDDTDLPTAVGACTTARCTDGVPSTPPAEAGTACGTGLECDDVGQCVGCLEPLQCPGSNTACQTKTCVNETCGVENTATGTKTTTQTTGDCQDVECDGSGNTMSVENDNDNPADAACTTGGCSAGVPTHDPKLSGTACGTGHVCNDTGVCGECNLADDCPATGSECSAATCADNTCGVHDLDSGTPTPTQIPGDCMQTQCDGSGATMPAEDDTDVPVDGNSCTSDVCTGGVPSNPALADGTVCADSGDSGNRCRAVACVPAVSLVLAGDGVTALSASSAALQLEERYTSDLALVPETGNPLALTCTQAGAAPMGLVQEGYMSRSVDERYVVFACYDTAAGTANVQGTASATVNRLVARVDSTLTAETSTRFTTAFDTNGIRSAATTDGNAIWAAGAGAANTGGTWSTTFGTTDGGTQVETAPNQNRCVEIAGGQLYGDSGSGNAGFQNVFTIGTGLPATSGQPATPLPGMPTTGAANPQSYAFVGSTLYVADDRTSVLGGGVQKWTFDGSSWSLITTFGGLVAGAHALAAYQDGANVVVVVVSAGNSLNEVDTYVDDGTTTPLPIATVLAGVDTGYHGVALAPH